MLCKCEYFYEEDDFISQIMVYCLLNFQQIVLLLHKVVVETRISGGQYMFRIVLLTLVRDVC